VFLKIIIKTIPSFVGLAVIIPITPIFPEGHRGAQGRCLQSAAGGARRREKKGGAGQVGAAWPVDLIAPGPCREHSGSV
jgi:hypothetical protein